MQKQISLIALILLVSISFVSGQKREVKVGAFSRVALGVPGKLYLRQGSPQKVEIEGDKETVEKIEIETDGNKLVVSHEGKWFSWGGDDEKSVTIYVTVENIEGIYVSGSGALVGENKISSNNLEVKLSGSGSVQIDASVKENLEADVSGSGKINIKGSCKNFESHLSGSGRIELASIVAQGADFAISGSGRIEAQGTVSTVEVAVSGSGKLLAANLEVQKCVARIAGSGDVEINVTNDLDAHIAGSGNISYKGNPGHLKSSASGSGVIRKL